VEYVPGEDKYRIKDDYGGEVLLTDEEIYKLNETVIGISYGHNEVQDEDKDSST